MRAKNENETVFHKKKCGSKLKMELLLKGLNVVVVLDKCGTCSMLKAMTQPLVQN